MMQLEPEAETHMVTHMGAMVPQVAKRQFMV